MQLVAPLVNEFASSLGCTMKWLLRTIVGSSWNRYLNDSSYYGGFEQEDLDQLFSSMRSNFSAWVSGFAPAAVGTDIHDEAVQEFSSTFISMRPDVALRTSQFVFQSDFRSILSEVRHESTGKVEDILMRGIVSEFYQEYASIFLFRQVVFY